MVLEGILGSDNTEKSLPELNPTLPRDIQAFLNYSDMRDAPGLGQDRLISYFTPDYEFSNNEFSQTSMVHSSGYSTFPNTTSMGSHMAASQTRMLS